MTAPLRTGPWRLTDLADVPKNGRRVFSCFSCGGGSTMGYKLAGFTVVGCCDIDPEMMHLYRTNHRPALPFLMPVSELNKKLLEQIPAELVGLDILDGSPPCSSFSISGDREKAWGENKKFREGQAQQVLDDLFFDFIETARILQPKVVVAENVKGLVIGNARGYVKQIFAGFSAAGYDTQLFLLNAAAMGVPQMRERTVFVARRKDLKLPPIVLNFREPPIAVRDAVEGIEVGEHRKLTASTRAMWERIGYGRALSDVHPNGSRFNEVKLNPAKPANTIVSALPAMHWSEPRHISGNEAARIQTFPEDYDFCGVSKQYVCGMSVPPFMMQRVADQIERQLLK